MTQTERLLARIKQLCRDNPSSLVTISIATDAKGEPVLWFPDHRRVMEGNDEQLIAMGIKPQDRKDHGE